MPDPASASPPRGPLILASASPRRSALLAGLGLPFRVVPSGVPEVADPALPPEEMARQLARRKAGAVAAAQPGGLVIGADTLVVLEGTVLGKPVDAADAARMLRLLRGRWHQVISGVAVIDAATGRACVGAVTTQVLMGDYADSQIAAYVASGEPLDKAGAYAIQGLGGGLVARIEGCYNNVVGFPLCELAALLSTFDVVPDGAGPLCALPDGQPCPRLPRRT